MSLITANGITVPSFMYGTAWKKDETARLVQLAVKNGFTAIDTANQIVHYNEVMVGDALLALAKNGVARESLFIQTKFTSVDGQRNQTPYDASAPLTTQVNQSMASSLLHLHTDYVDSYVLHGPYQRHHLGEADWEVWKAIEALYKTGKARMIGISNVTAEQLQELCDKAEIKPMMVQNRCYAVMAWDHEVREICKQHNIIYQGFSLLTANANVMSDAAVQSAAKRLKTGPAQVIFRFAMDLGMLPLTGTSSAQHMQEDLQAESLELTSEEIKAIAYVGLSSRY